MRYKKGVSIEEMVKQDELYLPVFLRCFIKSYYHLDKTETKKLILNPGLIHDKTLGEIVFSSKCVTFVG